MINSMFLVFFLIGHLLGNLQLFIRGEDGKTRFNEYQIENQMNNNISNEYPNTDPIPKQIPRDYEISNKVE